MNALARALYRMTRLLWPLGFGRPPEPPAEPGARSTSVEERPPTDEHAPGHQTQIPPDQQPGGGPPHR